MGVVKVKIENAQIKRLSQKLYEMNAIQFNAVALKSLKEMMGRAKIKSPSPGGTPVDTGELRKSVGVTGTHGDRSSFTAELGYTEEYAPHVEYGHRTKDGGWVPGQKYLAHNVEIQRPIYKQDLKNAIKKG